MSVAIWNYLEIYRLVSDLTCGKNFLPVTYNNSNKTKRKKRLNQLLVEARGVILIIQSHNNYEPCDKLMSKRTEKLGRKKMEPTKEREGKASH